MTDTVIERVDLLGRDQQELLVFTDQKGRLIEDSGFELTGVDGEENEAPLQIENKNDIYHQEYLEEVHTEQEDLIFQQTIKVELYPLEEGLTKLSSVPEIIAPHTVQEYIKPEGLYVIPGVLKSSILKFQTRQDYIPSMTVSNYAINVDQLKDHRAIHPDEHMLFMRTIQ